MRVLAPPDTGAEMRRLASTAAHRAHSRPHAAPHLPAHAASAAAQQQQQPAALPSWAVYTAVPGARSCAVVVGWLGARSDLVARYAAVYQSLGLSTLAVTPPLAASLVPCLGDRASAAFVSGARDALAASAAAAGDGADGAGGGCGGFGGSGGSLPPLVLHAASNGGFHFLSQVLRSAVAPRPGGCSAAAAADAAALLASARGVLLDCAPARVTPDVAWRALASIATGRPAELPPAGADAAASAAPAGALAALSLYLRSPGVAARLGALRGAWSAPGVGDALRGRPLRLLYASHDALIPAAEVRAFAAARRAEGWSRVRAQAFQDAPHVELLRVHPAAYSAAVADFLAECGLACDAQPAQPPAAAAGRVQQQ